MLWQVHRLKEHEISSEKQSRRRSRDNGAIALEVSTVL